MGPQSKQRPHQSAPVVLDKSHPCWADVRAGLEEAERGETIALTDDELDAWAQTGELPERVQQWHDERLHSRRGT
jgi:hypothetical protein